jgi:diguanylate cyclase (GGDEF)-like protein/putative nucleotidyltransferase with HDIG domain
MGATDPTGVLDWTTTLDPAGAARCESALNDLGRLPVFDGTVQRILAVVDDTDASNDALVTALGADATFAANLLRFSNSAARSHSVRAGTIRQAVMFVGRDALRRLTLETATYRFLERSRGNGNAACGQLHLHAMSVATGASGVADRSGHAGDVAHLAGLLHDVGKLVLPRAFGEDILDDIALAAPSGRARAAMERERLGIDHAQAGALLARRWSLPESVAAAIAWHHGGPEGDECPTAEVACVQLANEVAAMLCGAPCDQDLLQRALARAGLHADVLDRIATEQALASATALDTSLQQRVSQLEKLAASDDLTGIANRRHWTHTVRRALADGHSGTVVLIDVDDFKSVNDTHGHPVGDLVLREVALLMRGYGQAARLGGDEFALWSTAPPAQVHAHAVELLDRLADECASRADLPDAIGLSAGIATAPDHGTDLDSLLVIADRALYAAKHGGRGRVEVAVAPTAAAPARVA